VEAYLDQDRLRGARARADSIEPAPPVRRQATRLAPTDAHPLVEQDPRLHATLLRSTQLTDASETFAEDTGEAPRIAESDTLLVSGTGEARVIRVQLLDAAGVEHRRFRSGEPLVIAVTFRTTEPVEDPIFGVAIFRNDGVYVFGPNTGFDQVLRGRWHGIYTVYIHYPSLPLLAGTYRVSVAIYDSGHVRPMAWHNQLYEFEIEQEVDDHGLVQLAHRWGMIVHHDETGER
jgi:hypothetical protein